MIVRKLRLQRGWSQEQLAAFTGLSVAPFSGSSRAATRTGNPSRPWPPVLSLDGELNRRRERDEGNVRQGWAEPGQG